MGQRPAVCLLLAIMGVGCIHQELSPPDAPTATPVIAEPSEDAPHPAPELTWEMKASLDSLMARAFISEPIPGTQYFIEWRDTRNGSGRVLAPGDTVLIRFKGRAMLEGKETGRGQGEKVLVLGTSEVGKGMEFLLEKMTVGSLFEARLREEMCGGIREGWADLPPTSILSFQLEVVKRGNE